MLLFELEKLVTTDGFCALKRSESGTVTEEDFVARIVRLGIRRHVTACTSY